MNFIFALFALVASAALQVLMTPKPTKPEPASIDDFDLPIAEEGTPVPVIFGDVWIDSYQILWYGNLNTSEVKSDGSKK